MQRIPPTNPKPWCGTGAVAPGPPNSSDQRSQYSATPGNCASWRRLRRSAVRGSGRTEFDDAVLGNLPTHVGLVWTDGVNPVSFQALDAAGSVLGSFGPAFPAGVGYAYDDVAEDIFIAAVFPEGIKSIRITGGAGGGIEVDHLQYGFGAEVPAPGALPLMLTALLGAAGSSRVRRRAVA